MKKKKGIIMLGGMLLLSSVFSAYIFVNREDKNLGQETEKGYKAPIVLSSTFGILTSIMEANAEVEFEELQDIEEAQDIEEVEAPEEKISQQETIIQEEQMEDIEKERTPQQQKQDMSGYLNNYVLDVIKTYNFQQISYPYLLNQDYENYNGVTENIYYNNKLLLKAHPSGNRASHCSGITFEVFFKAMTIRNQRQGLATNDFNGMSWEELYDFVLTWYAATGPKHQSNIAVAVEKYGIGKAINKLEEAKAGDFVDISRENGTGHTMVFLDWIREENKIIGLKYWSSQQTTNGIGYREEYFNITDSSGNKYGNVIIDKVYIARILPIDQYKRR